MSARFESYHGGCAGVRMTIGRIVTAARMSVDGGGEAWKTALSASSMAQKNCPDARPTSTC